ncbi:serpentine type 7TM GPCR chemoreceptor str domain-containing protein [Ditylenchus destructor]|uniref:Serpentine type 7TM GPCR chemoreceptor str domain-containing protein n=1 Tax=Ditylenchus destructor TaxID=166010 RepID=A0AAD4N619_9BILA|nr:serpentine type 7TM GPCR chemoreceptor str domain-containing protein [Ditylenchus destructor]
MLALSLVALLESIWNGAIIRHNENSWDENSKILAQNPYFIDNLNTFVVLSQNNSYSFCHTSFVAIIVVTSYLAVTYTAIKTLRHLKSARLSMSQQTRQMHDSFTRLLIVQAFIPLILLFLPILLLILAVTILPVEMPPEFGIIFSTTIAIIPLANSLSIIFIVPQYRRIVLGKCFAVSPQSTNDYTANVPNC